MMSVLLKEKLSCRVQNKAHCQVITLPEEFFLTIHLYIKLKQMLQHTFPYFRDASRRESNI